MRFGVRLPVSGPFASPEAITEMAVAAERLGYDAVSVHDHANWGYEDRYHFYAGSREASDSRGGPTDFYGSIPTLSYLAGVTRRVQLVPDALCLAWRSIIPFARDVLTLHRLSGGRFVLCICVGNVKGDFRATGTSWEERGPITVEKLKVLRMLIDQPGPLSFQGKYVSFTNAELTPQPAGLSLWYAGVSDIALKRAARYGEGWFPAGSPEYFRQKVPELRREAKRAGRGHVKFEIASVPHTCIARTDEEARKIAYKTIEAHAGSDWVSRADSTAQAAFPLVGSPNTLAAFVREFESAGVTLLNLGFVGHSVESILEQMEMFAREVVPLLK